MPDYSITCISNNNILKSRGRHTPFDTASNEYDDLREEKDRAGVAFLFHNTRHGLIEQKMQGCHLLSAAANAAPLRTRVREAECATETEVVSVFCC